MEFVALKDIIKQPDLYFAHKKGGKTEENTEKEIEKEVEGHSLMSLEEGYENGKCENKWNCVGRE